MHRKSSYVECSNINHEFWEKKYTICCFIELNFNAVNITNSIDKSWETKVFYDVGDLL